MAVSKRSRHWWFVQVLDNLPEDWRTQLTELMIPGCFIVHDRDTKLNEEGEWEPKRPHIHCILRFGNAVRADTVLDALPCSFNVKMVKPVSEVNGAYRYMMHYDIEDKAQYERDEIVHMNGFRVNVSDVFNVEFSDVYQLINELQITNFAVLMNVLVELKPEFVGYVSSHVNLVKTYITEFQRANF